MYRCFRPGRRRAALGIAAAALALAGHSAAQVQRNFPANALRGSIAFGQPPEIALNGDATRLAPGARIRGTDNMLQMTGALMGSKWLVHYTLDTLGQVNNVWILRAEEAAVRPWPRTTVEAQEWSFDPAAQTWTRP